MDPVTHELDASEILIGHQYQYEEKYLIQAEVTIIESHNRLEWFGYRVRVERFIGGMCQFKVGQEFSCGIDLRHPQYKDWRIKPLGSPTDYVFIGQRRNVEMSEKS